MNLHTALVAGSIIAGLTLPLLAADRSEPRTYQNTLKPLPSPTPLLADHPEFIAPITEERRYEAPPLIDDEGADLSVRAWRFSYNARGIIEMPNRLKASETAVIMVHPWGIDDGQGWTTPEPAGVCDFCTPTKNHLAGKHTRTVINPLLKRLRPHVAFTMYSLRGAEHPIHSKLYRSLTKTPTNEERAEGRNELAKTLGSFKYQGQPIPETLTLSRDNPVKDYFQQFPGLDASAKYNNAGFWDLPIPICADVDVDPQDIVLYDQAGYPPIRDFLKKHGVKHVILTGYATDMCFCKTTAGYENLSQDFNVFLVGDATLATFPANDSPRHATNAAISLAALSQLMTQSSWIRMTE